MCLTGCSTASFLWSWKGAKMQWPARGGDEGRIIMMYTWWACTRALISAKNPSLFPFSYYLQLGGSIQKLLLDTPKTVYHTRTHSKNGAWQRCHALTFWARKSRRKMNNSLGKRNRKGQEKCSNDYDTALHISQNGSSNSAKIHIQLYKNIIVYTNNIIVTIFIFIIACLLFRILFLSQCTQR